jgi:diadenosine tetraphosphate (Ap4A) HIT family hydrolase
VPRIAGLRDLHDVPRAERTQLFDEIEAVSTTLQALVRPHKLNVAALGNQVPQLHIHVIARKMDDAAWPAPVWGSGPAVPYSSDVSGKLKRALADALGVE